jgi:FtsP/CotA-like multicopper oxidase with cupredoxin domain
MIGKRKTTAKQTWWLAMLLVAAFTWAAESGNNEGGNAAPENRATAPIRIVDQYGRQVPSGKRYVGSEIFDVIVGPVGNDIRFVPDNVNISVGDTVRWTWESNTHSVTSGTSCTADGQFCSPDNMNCETAILNDTGFVYEFTFTQPGRYPYFCALHCFVGMRGVINVSAGSPTPTPTATPTITPTPTVTPTPTPTPFSHRLRFPPVATDADISVGIHETCVQILDGPCTNMWTYRGTYPGLTIRRPTGQTTNVTFTNNLDPAAGALTVHNHGNHSSPENDGQPDDFLIGTGESRTYTYTGLEDGVDERGTMHFYHDHRMDVTGRNVWMGLTGMYIVDDPADPATLPSGAFDVPLAIADRQFDANNQIPYVFNPLGVTGDKFLVNGVYQPYFDVGDRKYRLRILNASNFRTYNLALSTGDSFTQIGTESGLLPAPIVRGVMRMGPAERLDVIVDFSGKLGQDVYLTDTLTAVQLLKLRVTHHEIDNSTIPPTLRALPDIGEPTVTRTWTFDRTDGHWTINGLRFDPDRIDAQPVLGTTEKWVFTNPTGMAHTVHIHDVDQQCLTRNGGPCFPYETMKETWYLEPSESIEVKLRFTDHTGRYMLHCHMIEHADDGMMAQFEVVGPTPTPTPTPGSITLSAAGRKVGGINTVRLDWSGATSSQVDIYRNSGPPIATVPNTGTYTDSTGDTGRAQYTYKVCEAGTQTCSNVERVKFRH